MQSVKGKMCILSCFQAFSKAVYLQQLQSV